MVDLLNIPRLAVAVSGGSDSMALLRLLLAARGGDGLTALTVDHGLRAESRAEAEQVAHWCAALGVRHSILTWAGEKPTRGLQAKARVARYDLMADWCRQHEFPVLLTAHTLNDQAETVSMRKARTLSAASLAGIWPERPWHGVTLRRPLLDETRCRLRAYLKSVDQGWLDDPSNDNPDFERVRIRRSLRLGSLAGLAEDARQAQAATRSTVNTASGWLRAQAQVHPTGLITLPRADLAALPGDVQTEVLGRVIAICGAGLRPERADVGRLMAAVSAPGAFRRSLGGALVAGRQRHVLIGREPGRMMAATVVVPDSGHLLWDGRFHLTAPSGSSVQPAGRLRRAEDAAVPDFVRAGLPVLTLPDGTVIFPHFERCEAITVTLGERFHL